MENAKVSGLKSQAYSGQQLTPSGFTVKYGKTTLEEGKDFTVSYGENVSAGLGTVILAGTGNANASGVSFQGAKTVFFKITGVPVSKTTLNGFVGSVPYTGSEVTQPFTLSHPTFGALREGTDYVSAYANNVNAGTATLTITGKGGFTGTLKKTFKITPLDVSKADVTVSEAKFTKGGAKPEVSVKLGGAVLEEGRDYALAYKNNTKVGSGASVTVKGKGNYAKSVTKGFNVSPKPLNVENGLVLLAADKAADGKKGGWQQGFKVCDSDGKALAAKKDYDPSSAEYSVLSGTLNGSAVSAKTPLAKDDTVGEGSVIEISVAGAGDYAGGILTGAYRILQAGRDISKAAIQLNAQAYPGKGKSVEITDASQFKGAVLKTGGKSVSLAFGADFEVVPGSYVNNGKTGTAKVTFRGIGAFGGTKTVSFKIGQRSVSDQ